MKKSISIFFIWLIAVNVFAIIGNNRFNLKPDNAYNWINPLKVPQVKTYNPFDLHAKWDSWWYIDLVKKGYIHEGVGKLSNIVFFPAYPILIKTLTFWAGDGTRLVIIVGTLLSCLFLLFSVILFYKYLLKFHSGVDPYWAIFFLLVFPTAFFFTSLYTESLFLFLSIGVFYYGRQGKFLIASIFGMAAALTRVTGVLLFFPLLIEYYFYYRKIKPSIIYLLLIPAGTGSFFAYHWLKFGDPFLFLRVEATWGRTFTIAGDHFSLISPAAAMNFYLDAAYILIAVIAGYLVLKRLRPSYAIYMALTLAVALSTGTTMSIGRYILILFPMYILAASIKNLEYKMAWALCSILLLALNIISFVNFYWAG